MVRTDYIGTGYADLTDLQLIFIDPLCKPCLLEKGLACLDKVERM